WLTNSKFEPDTPKLDIYLVDGRPQMLQIWPAMGPRIAGYYSSTPGGILAVAMEPAAGESWNEGRETLLHEYAHHFMMQVGSAAMPAWYVEGFAEYLMTADFRPDRIEFGGYSRGRAWVLIENPWSPLEQILGRAKGVDIDNFYAQSWLLTHYLYRTEGMGPKLNAYLRRVALGEDPVATFRAEVSDDLPAFQAKLKSYLKSRRLTFTRMNRKPPAAADVTVTALPPAADMALLALVAVQLPQTPENDAAQLAKIRAAAARYPQDPWAKRALAIGEAAAGDRKVAAGLLDAQLALAPTDPGMLRWRARLYRPDKADAPAADVVAARGLLGRAFKASPNDWLVLRDYVDTFLARDAQLTQSVLDVMVKAQQLAPQERSLAMRTGVEMARAGDYALAARMIGPVVNNPHSSDPMLLEQGLLLALRKGEKASVDAALDGLFFGSGRISLEVEMNSLDVSALQ
ncbi:MAG: hypothetical protein ACRC1J_08600, partial [Sandaracinobacteroides sp.]